MSALPAYFHHARPEIAARVAAAGARVLDVGCAAGALGALLLERGAREVVGIELHPEAARLARTRLDAVLRCDLNALAPLPFPEGHFDHVVLADVLEHLVEPAAVLAHLARWLAPGGRVVLSLPNVRHESVLLPLLVDGRWDYEDAGILDRTHLRFFTRDGVLRLLADAGLALDGPLSVVRTQPSPALARAAELVAALGGDRDRFTVEATTYQFVCDGRRPGAAASAAPWAPGPWRGARGVRVLVAPAPGASWEDRARAALAELAGTQGVTLGVVLPSAPAAPPPALAAAAAAAGIDLVLVEAPSAAARERLVAGASLVLHGDDALAAAAERAGVDLAPRRAA